MTDLITPLLISLFGGVMAIAVFAFFLLMKSENKPRFETRDYYETYRDGNGFPRRGNPFKSAQSPAERNEQRTLAAIIIGLVVIAVAVSVLFDVFEGLLIIFLLPVIVRFVRTRKAENKRRAANDENRRSY